jgi:hypothetical protein
MVGDGGVEKRHGALLGVIRHDLDEGDAGGIVDADMDELPADAAITALAPLRSPVMRWPTALNLTSFLMSSGSNRQDDRALTAGSTRQVPVHLAC